MLKWFLRTIWAALASVAFLLWWIWREEALWQSLAGFWVPALLYATIIGLECAMAAAVNRGDDSPRAGPADWAGVWMREILVSLKVFGWYLPIRPGAVADQMTRTGAATTGVVFIHGFMCNRGIWTPWMEALRAEGRIFAAVTLEPVRGPIDAYVATIEEAVQRVTDATGRPPILVCHSMGGLAARAWLCTGGAESLMRIRHVITVGTPHQGTWLARFAWAPNARQMRRQSPWLRELTSVEPRGLAAQFTCWYSNCDNIVFPPSTATLAGADNRLAPCLGHVELTANERVMGSCLDLIRAS